MTELFQAILMRVTLAGIASAAALSVAKEGALRETVRLAAGLLMVLALVQPLAQLRLGSFGDLMKGSGVNVSDIEMQNAQTTMGSVGATIASVVEDHAAEQGISCSVTITMKTDENGVLQTDKATVYYRASDEPRLDELRTILENDCGISADRQEMIRR